MSDAEQSLSDDDGADIFGSDSDDQGSEIDQSLDLPSVSLDDKSPQTGDSDQRCGFNTSSRPQDELEDEELSDHESPGKVKDEDFNQAELGSNRSTCKTDGDIQVAKHEESEENEVVAVDLPSAMAVCESPKLPDRNVNEKHEQPSDDLNINRESDFHHDEASLVDPLTMPTGNKSNVNEMNSNANVVNREYTQTHSGNELKPHHEALTEEPDVHRDEVGLDPLIMSMDINEMNSDASLVNCENTQAHSGNKLKTLLAESEALIEELNQETSIPDDLSGELGRISPPKSLEKADIVKASPTSKVPLYTVETLFPVVYEKDLPRVPTPKGIAKVVPVSSVTDGQKPCQRRKTQGEHPNSSFVSRLTALQQQLHAARSELVNSTRTFKLQLSMAEADSKKLSQRNTRLKKQLSIATAELQRTNAEMTKLKTENELYAAKLPGLQAELLEETTQVDETRAQSLQTQLILTQLKARSHVLQTRNSSLESHNNRLTQQLRECQQRLRKKTTILEQQTEKTNRIEAELTQLKTTQCQERLEWKHRLSTALQRFEHDKVNLEAQYKASERKELRELKGKAEKATKKRRTAEAIAAKLEEELRICKLELSSANNSVNHHITDLRTHESLLRKAHRTEATLRNDLAVCKSKLRALQDSRRRMTNLHSVKTRRQPNQIPIELLLPLDESSDEDDNQEEKQCHCYQSSPKSEIQSPLACTECPQLQDQLHQLQKELKRVRSLHIVELHAQQSVLDALLHAKGNLHFQ